jgi:arsenical pump membrane protein
VLVAGLLLIGLVADDDGLFAAAGRRLAAVASHDLVLFAGMVVLVGVVTATLNLDTSVAFLTPVLVYAARSRGSGEAALLYGCLLLSNAGSLLLPGSNLTNLIVLGHLRLTGGQFAARMWLPWLGALLVTAAVVAGCELRPGRAAGTARAAGNASGQRTARARAAARVPRTGWAPGTARAPHTAGPDRSSGRGRVPGLGAVAVCVATVLVLVVSSPALPVLAAGLLAAGVKIARGRIGARQAFDVLGVGVLAGLFGTAVALGTLGRVWSGPATLLAHLPAWATAPVAGLATVLVNNLPAASMLAARTPPHPFALLVGLNLGPNLCVTGSLAWLLWLRSARSAGTEPSLLRASRIGLVAVPLAMAVAVGALAISGGG